MRRATLAAVFRGPDFALDLREIAIPYASGSAMLGEVLASTLSGGDLHTMHGRRTEPVSTILGHEVLGRVRGARHPIFILPETRLQTSGHCVW